MDYKVLLRLAAIPALTGSILTLLIPASAQAKASAASTYQASCSLPVDKSQGYQNNKTNEASAKEIANEDPMMDFSAAESDAAVTLFGCDCPACLNSLTQLRSQSFNQVLLSSSQGHCWTSLQQRSSPQKVQEVLQILEAEDAKQ